MTEIKSILVPVDFSDLSFKALQAANKLAAVFDATITPTHVHVPVPEVEEPYVLTMGTSVYPDYESAESALKERLASATGEYVDASRLNEPVITFGNAAQSIVDLSSSYDCIVMSTHGRTGFSRLLLGSVAEKVLRLSHVPVMVIEENSDIGDFERILVTTDFSDNATAAYPYARAFAKKAGSNVHLLHILSFDQFDDEESDYTLKSLRSERLKLAASDAFHDLKGRVTNSVITTSDSPHTAIYKHTKESGDYNLVIMSTVGRTGLNYLMMGSTTANVVRHVDTAVLSINPGKPDDT